MTTYRLDRLFAPRTVAVVGASAREHSVGRKILCNLKAAGFPGLIHLVNPNYAEVEGIKTTRSVTGLPETDLLVITSPPATVPQIVADAGARGCSSAIIITAGLGSGQGSLAEAAVRAAGAYRMRLLGPNCLGVQVPRAKLDASFAAHMSQPGDLALISQSGAIVAGLVEWAARRSIGFSGVVSLGNQIDVDFGDLLDYFATDKTTRAIVLYIESIQDAPKFMSAARAAARIKPVMVIKSGRHAQGAAAARTHTGALAGTDAVYDAAFRRAGLVRLFDLDELFDAAETLGHVSPFDGNRLAILTNGGGIGVLAVDRLIDLGGHLALLSSDTIEALDGRLPQNWSRTNPVDISGDADADRYGTALAALLADPQNDGILVINVPTALASARDAAASVISTVRTHRNQRQLSKPVFSVWVGDEGRAETAFDTAGIPYFQSESDAVRGFMHLVWYREGQNALMATPPSLPQDFQPDVAAARRTIEPAIECNRTWLDPIEITKLMAAYGIPIASAALAHTPDEAVAVARGLLASGPVALKILSPDIVHKSDVGGVRINLTDEDAVRAAAADVLSRARIAKPDARIIGITIHPMIVRAKAYELIAGVADDATFGPVIVFGSGGTSVEVVNDKALALPPLDLCLAYELIGRTRISRILKGYRNVPAADCAAIALVLVKLSQLVADFPEIRELDLNPLLADGSGVIALDARVAVSKTAARQQIGRHTRFAIRPYPKEWEHYAQLQDGTPVYLRPIRPEDETLYPPFLLRVSHDDLRLRFFAPVKDFSHSFIARFTQIDYARAMAFLALDETTGEMLGVSRLHRMAHSDAAEYAILVRSDMKGRGLGWVLMQTIIRYAEREGIQALRGEVLAENSSMLHMCSELGFQIADSPEDAQLRIVTLPIIAASTDSLNQDDGASEDPRAVSS